MTDIDKRGLVDVVVHNLPNDDREYFARWFADQNDPDRGMGPVAEGFFGNGTDALDWARAHAPVVTFTGCIGGNVASTYSVGDRPPLHSPGIQSITDDEVLSAHAPDPGPDTPEREVRTTETFVEPLFTSGFSSDDTPDSRLDVALRDLTTGACTLDVLRQRLESNGLFAGENELTTTTPATELLPVFDYRSRDDVFTYLLITIRHNIIQEVLVCQVSRCYP